LGGSQTYNGMTTKSIILIVDDDPIGRSALLSLLSGEGYQLETAEDGPSALAMAEVIVPDVVLLDVMMPVMDGYEVTRRMRSSPRLGEIPILLVTALDLPEYRLAGLNAGADDFISKPFDRVELRSRLRAITRLNRFRRLSEEREKYKHLFERSPCGLFVIDAAMNIVEVNPQAEQLLSQVLPKGSPPSLVLLVPAREGEDLAQLLQASEAQREGGPLEVSAIGLHGKSLWFQLTVSRFPAAGKGARLVAIRDLTAERLAEEKFRHAQKLESIGQLASGIAHDFNNLLTAINGFSEIALQGLPPDSPAREDIEAVHQAGARATVLTRQLLAFTRRQGQPPRAIDLSKLVADCEKLLRTLVGTENTMECRLTRPIGLFHGDPGQVEQILVNLVVNARDAMSEGGVLRISTSEYTKGAEGGEPERHFVRLLVEDTGCGMTRETRERLFEPFFTTKEPGKGTGLGLATVYGIVKDFGGHIDVMSEPGQGSTFIVDFPRLERRVLEDTSYQGESRLPGGRETILLAEDDDAVRAFARTALEAVGYTVLSGRDGVEAIRLDRQFRGTIHLLLTDMTMPRLSGQMLLDVFRRSRPEARVVITSGGNEDAGFASENRRIGIQFLQKPFSQQSLLRAVRTALDS